MLVETEKVKNDAFRMQIISHIMDIYDSKSLELLKTLAYRFHRRELPDHPMPINKIAELMGAADIIRILDVLKDSEPGQIAVEQMKEVFKGILENCSECNEIKTEKLENWEDGQKTLY